MLTVCSFKTDLFGCCSTCRMSNRGYYSSIFNIVKRLKTEIFGTLVYNVDYSYFEL